MNFLRGFTDVFERIKVRPFILAPVFGVLLITLIFNLILYGLRGDMEFGNFLGLVMLSFIFGVIEWALAFLAVGITTSMMENKKFEKTDSRMFFNFFAFSIFMAFFLMIGFSIHPIIGLVILLLILYIPNWFLKSNACDLYAGFGWNLSFIFHGIRSAYVFILVVGTALLTLVPYAGNYLAIFFYVVWVANTYVHIMENEK